MAEPHETYVAHLATLGIDATMLALDKKGTLAGGTAKAGGTPKAGDTARAGATMKVLGPSSRLPRLLVGSDDAQHSADLELGDPLGKGGMGVVWSATQVALRRHVAVKRLRDERVGPEAEAQLMREALVTGALEHPNIVPVHTLGLDDEGRPLLVMKRIEGTPWNKLLRPLYTEDGPADARELERHLGIFMQVCQALEFAHAQGVVHRDIKPENVMVGSFGEVYVLDWGIAVSTRDDAIGLPAVEPGTLVGTPAYMAPEMAAADEAIDARTDVYLLGATLHELVMGEPRHQADGVFAALTLAFESKAIEYPPWVPAELAEICNRATHREPAERFGSAREMREALLEFQRHGSSRELADEGWQRLELLEDILGPDLRTVTADAIQIHALASEGRFAFERAREQWSGNAGARKGLQRLLELMIHYELSNGNVRSAAGLLGALPEARPQLEREVDRVAKAQLERRREIAKLEKLRYDADINVFTSTRRRFSLLHGAVLALLAVGLFALRKLGLHQPGYPDAIVVILVLGGVVFMGRRRATTQSSSNEVNRRLFDSILGSLLFVELVFLLGFWGDIPFPVGLALAMLVGGATCGMMVIYFDRRMVWTALGFVLTGVAIMAMPELRGLWIAVGGFASFASSAILWREVEQGRHVSQRPVAGRAETPRFGTPLK
ncbi:serine/threonine-protein kinase [Paraliomyxa miuraensis]|uniref:serine/threonine-protein kinase n=1 Tax=Paraliomyxa miuraensis TaxID=376150 RepID=UPI002258CCF2|nr:serine/threonine-protein kinase [Paraliomyxa miuraensis]MCX4246743.1 serine/threonine protein kinase [Paraliomyxa miuraensis]